MNGSELKTMAESILDGQTIDETLFYILANVAKDKRESLRPWQMLRKWDTSKSVSSGDNSSSSKDLPDDWNETIRITVGQDTEYFPLPFDQYYTGRNYGRRYTIDVGNLDFYILGNVGVGGTIYHLYKKNTPDITSSVGPVWPDKFHPLIAFDVAGYYQMGVDADDIYARMSPENKAAAFALSEAMALWDANLQNKSRGSRLHVADVETEVDLGNM